MSTDQHSSTMSDPPILFAPAASLAFGRLVGQHLRVEPSALEEREFEDGEHKARPLVSVRGRDVYVLHSLYADGQQSVNDKLCRLLFLIGALKDAGAGRVTAVVPYLAYARKDRKSKARDPVTTRFVAGLFEAVGTDVVVTLDVHNLSAFQNAFRCRTEHLEAAGLFVDCLAPRCAGRELVVVSPDEGGIKRAEQFRRRLGRATGKVPGAAFCEKYRSGGTVSGEMLVGEVGGKDVVILDDLVGSGTTLARAAATCRAHGASNIVAVATHGLFVADAPAILAASAIQEVLVSDSVSPFRLGQSMAQGKVRIVSCAALVAEAVARLHGGGSIVELLEQD